MTEQEAIKIIKNEHCARCDKKFPCNGCYIGITIKVLEKQIPKKVKKFPCFTIHPYPRFIYIDMCPNCDHVVEEYEDDHIYPRTRNDCCNRCGQALDWKVEE